MASTRRPASARASGASVVGAAALTLAGYRIVTCSARCAGAGVGPRAATPRVASTRTACTTPTAYGAPESRRAIFAVGDTAPRPTTTTAATSTCTHRLRVTPEDVP